jgi:hypothetical protein
MNAAHFGNSFANVLQPRGDASRPLTPVPDRDNASVSCYGTSSVDELFFPADSFRANSTNLLSISLMRQRHRGTVVRLVRFLLLNLRSSISFRQTNRDRAKGYRVGGHLFGFVSRLSLERKETDYGESDAREPGTVSEVAG